MEIRLRSGFVYDRAKGIRGTVYIQFISHRSQKNVFGLTLNEMNLLP